MVVDTNTQINQMRQWYQQLPGRMLLELEQAHLRRVLPHLYGEYALQIGGPPDAAFLNHSPIKHKVQLTDDDSLSDDGVIVQGDISELPFAPDSMDLVILPHVLEFADSPRQLLSQCYQMMAPYGHLVIFSFVPWSLWGLWRRLNRRQGMPWAGQFLSRGKIDYWLTAIGYGLQRQENLCYHWPTKSPRIAKYSTVFELVGQFCWSRLGSVYMVVAQKQMHTITPIKASWWARKPASSIGCAEPSANTSHRFQNEDGSGTLPS
jgi:SAM-dependent methyltransferase